MRRWWDLAGRSRHVGDVLTSPLHLLFCPLPPFFISSQSRRARKRKRERDEEEDEEDEEEGGTGGGKTRIYKLGRPVRGDGGS